MDRSLRERHHLELYDEKRLSKTVAQRGSQPQDAKTGVLHVPRYCGVSVRFHFF